MPFQSRKDAKMKETEKEDYGITEMYVTLLRCEDT
jgi:hypothetical protein